MGNRFWYLLIVWLLGAVHFVEEAKAQTIAPGFNHQVWTIDEGLPINSLNDITVTDDGFVWISTHNGMVRFDGLTHSEGNLFKVFNKGNNKAFSTNSLYKILEVSDSEFLVLENKVGESQSVVRYRNQKFENLVTSTEVNFPYDMAHLDSKGTFWVVRNGKVYSLSEEGWKDEYPSIKMDVEGYLEFKVISRDDIWVLAKSKNELYRIQNGELKRIGKEQGLTSDRITSFVVTKNGNAWFLTSNGIEIIEDGRATFLHEKFLSFIEGRGSLNEDPTLDDRIIYKTAGDYSNSKYVVTKGEIQFLEPIVQNSSDSGRQRFSLATPKNRGNKGTGWLRVNNTFYYDGNPVLELDQDIRGSKVDKAGGMWFVVVGELHYLKRNLFDSYTKQTHDIENTYPLLEDHEGTIWAGLLAPNVVRKQASEFEQFNDPELFKTRRYFSLLEDIENNIWFGAINGLGFWDRKSEFKLVEPDINTDLRFVRGLFQDSRQTIWVGSENDILSFSKETGWRRISISNHDGEIGVRFVYEDQNGTIWFGSDSIGLLYYDENENAIKIFKGNSLLEDQSIRSMYQDEDSTYWVGLEGFGLVRMELYPNKEIETISYFNQANGLQGQVIHSILEDDYGRIWMSSNSGIFWVSKEELNNYALGKIPQIHSTVYSKSDGLPGIEANGGVQSPGIKTLDGRFLFSMISGIAVIDPDKVNESMTQVVSRIDGLITSDSSYTSTTNPLRLKKEERDIQFNYAGFNFQLAPKNIKFRYQLKGYDDKWTEVGSRKEAYYTNVSGGSYTFVVQAALFGSDWPDTQSEFPVTVSKYFYELVWFKMFVLLGVLALLYSWFKWRIRSSEKRANKLSKLVDEQTLQLTEQTKKLQELDKAKSKFFANVSHEFRTPLTLIIGPLKDITKNTATITKEVTERKAKLALRNSNRLLKLVNQILDISKVESGTMELKVREVDIVILIRSIIKAFGSLAEQRQVSISQEYFADSIPLYLDSDSIEKVMVNILSNAFKFTPPSGKISVSIKDDANHIQIEIKDSGPGVELNELPHIFDRFYQTNESNAVNQVGTGIGLALTKELIELHKGSIRAESELGLGLSIILTLKKGRAHFEEHEFVEEAEEIVSLDEIDIPIEEVKTNMGKDQEVGKTTILIIDDNQEIRSYLSEHLSPLYNILESDNGLDGLASVKENLPDIIICDVMMPKMDGYEFCQVLKSNPETDFIPVILLTAKAEQSDKLEGLGLGADDYIMKPFDIEEVKARAKNLIQSRKKLIDRYSKSGITLELPAVEIPKADVAFIEEIRDYILAGMEDENFGVEELATKSLMSRRTLHNRVKKITNKSTSDLIREVRLETAHQLLTANAGTISEIAYSVGFKSIAHFSRVFKERYKTKPSEVAAASE